MANTWGRSGTTWGQGLWGEQDNNTVTLTGLSLSVSFTPGIFVCVDLPKRGINLGLLESDVPKLKSLSDGFVSGADCCKTCTLFKNTSLSAVTL